MGIPQEAERGEELDGEAADEAQGHLGDSNNTVIGHLLRLDMQVAWRTRRPSPLQCANRGLAFKQASSHCGIPIILLERTVWT